MLRWISLLFVGLVALGVIILAPVNVRADVPSQVEATAVGPIVITAVAPSQPQPPIPAPYPYRLVLTLNDNGGAFTIPLGPVIDLPIPQFPFSQLAYDPA